MESESKLTFGNILVGLLLLGVVVVIGLIVFVYFALTKPETRRTTVADDTPAAQQVDRLSPDGRTLPSVPRSEASKVAAPTTNAAPTNNKAQQAEADKIANDMHKTNDTTIANVDSSMENNLAMGEEKPKQPKRTPPAPKTTKRTQTADSEKTTSERNTTINGERELKPTNQVRRSDTTEGERKLEPTNKRQTTLARETTTTTRENSRRETPANSNSSGGERKLEPVKKTKSNDFDNLF